MVRWIDVDMDACCVCGRKDFCHVRPNPLTTIEATLDLGHYKALTRDLVIGLNLAKPEISGQVMAL
jgi:hypothetical protein